MTATYELTPEAQADLVDIFRYGERTWGIEQARRYHSELFQVFVLLAENPQAGRTRKELFPEIRSFPSRAHVIFYGESTGKVVIVRVLHGASDIDATFEGYNKT